LRHLPSRCNYEAQNLIHAFFSDVIAVSMRRWTGQKWSEAHDRDWNCCRSFTFFWKHVKSLSIWPTFNCKRVVIRLIALWRSCQYLALLDKHYLTVDKSVESG